MVVRRVEKNYNLMERVQYVLGKKPIDLYVTNSLLEMEDHFSQNPPRKLCPFTKKPMALFFLYDFELKLKDGTDRDRIDRKWKDLLNRSDVLAELGDNKNDGFLTSSLVNYAADKILSLPAEMPFEIRQGAVIRSAGWLKGRTENYDIASNKYAFNDIYFVKIPLIGLRYTQDHPFIIEWFDVGNRIRPKKAKDKKRVECFGGLPAPAY